MNNCFVIFGGTGDLSFRKLFPALYNLNELGLLSEEYKIIGIGRRDYSTEDYIEIIKKWVKDFSRIEYTEEGFERLSRKITYFNLDMHDVIAYEKLGEFFKENNISDDIIYYYAVSPELFRYITKGLTLIHKRYSNNKVIIEKPFGKDLADAIKLNDELEELFKHDNIYRIDHYLGKEMIINIKTLRFNNTIFKGVWNNKFIDNIQINAFEQVGVETRAGYYEKSGAIMDMVQNHLLQILTIVGMDEPEDDTPEAIHKAQIKLLDEFILPNKDKIKDYLVMGQYEGYRLEEGVSKESLTETYAAIRIDIDNDRWKDTPFYIRTGKKMAKRESEVRIQFKDIDSHQKGNVILIRIQPDEGIFFKFYLKKPGSKELVEKVSMDYTRDLALENIMNTPEAYERLIQAARISDKSLFTTWGQISKSWNYVNKMVELYKDNKGEVYSYEVGSYGPKESDNILRNGDNWIIEK